MRVLSFALRRLASGHQKRYSQIVENSQARSFAIHVVTYKDHPAFVLSQKALPKLLCPWEIKQQELMKLGIDRVEVLEFDAELAATSAEDFLEKILIPRWQPKVIVVGYDATSVRIGEATEASWKTARSNLAIVWNIFRPSSMVETR
jgi:riboflavin kinase/FMN adenylyltransferase